MSMTQQGERTRANSKTLPLCMQGLETTVGKERCTIRSGTAVVATRTQVLSCSPPPDLHGQEGVDQQEPHTGFKPTT